MECWSDRAKSRKIKTRDFLISVFEDDFSPFDKPNSKNGNERENSMNWNHEDRRGNHRRFTAAQFLRSKRHRDTDGGNSLAPTSSTTQTRMKNDVKRQFEKCLNFNSNIIILFRDFFLYRILHLPSQKTFSWSQCWTFLSLFG